MRYEILDALPQHVDQAVKYPGEPILGIGLDRGSDEWTFALSSLGVTA
jgi:hypothetical protein